MSGLSMEVGGRTYLNTFDGFFELRKKEPEPGTIQRITKNGKTINVLRFNNLEGTVRGLEIKESEIAGVKMKFYVIIVEDDDKKIYQLDLAVNSSSTSLFLSRLMQADITKPLRIKIFATVENDKKKTQILVYQGSDKPFKAFWTKENPAGCPPMVEVMFKGKKEWDDTERNAYIQKEVFTKIVPKIVKPVAAAGATTTEGPDGPPDDVDDSGLPDFLKPGQGAPPPTSPPPGK